VSVKSGHRLHAQAVRGLRAAQRPYAAPGAAS